MKRYNGKASMPGKWYSEGGPERLGKMLATIFMAAVLALFLYAYLPHFL